MDRPLPEVPGVRHSWHQAGDVRLHVAEAGEGPPLVLLHGWPQHWYEWRALIGPLAERYRVLAPDLRGFGWSDAPPRGYDKETLAGDVLALLDGLGIERFRLAGHDWGGWIGFLLCLREPERVERYLALNIGLPFTPPSPRAALASWRLWYQLVLAAPVVGPAAAGRMARARTDGLVPRWAGADRAWSDEEARAFLSQFAEPERRHATMRLYRDFLTKDFRWLVAGRYRRPRLRTPTLLLHGAADHIVRPAMLAGYERVADDMRLELVEGCGHFIVDERPELVLARASEFFAAA
jgi:pimeloyl-ACP methyl ester carboxylesterase